LLVPPQSSGHRERVNMKPRSIMPETIFSL
jgi:hypothetical protein